MSLLDDQTLLETYMESVKLQLDDEFVHLITQEIDKRSIEIPAAAV
ncbi:Sporulation inhibitor A [Halobacillus dabanensis]|uniref:Sporulation inhibitor A n=1 Tax=Halobacillus dabanensis TaxID=240302 RepID=A0A1I3P260_HALDA|nr:sporulation histidine kinase inhibitor Sda [Halobacillus dabanensis]SFJ15427.1 Sporulation inhibitor A [Halobacillus dabanensis]